MTGEGVNSWEEASSPMGEKGYREYLPFDEGFFALLGSVNVSSALPGSAKFLKMSSTSLGRAKDSPMSLYPEGQDKVMRNSNVLEARVMVNDALDSPSPQLHLRLLYQNCSI